VPRSPFRGIESYRYADRAIFFARESETQELVRLVAMHRGVLLYGESGSGKSSLINAGLVPAAIEEGLLAERIRVQPRPGGELVVERIAVDGDDEELLPSYLALRSSGPRAVLSTHDVRRRLRKVTPDAQLRPLLVFDQLEELITLFETSRDPSGLDARATQQRIADFLVGLLRDRSQPVKLLLVFREDYLARIKQLLARCPELLDQSLRLSPPSTTSLDRILRGPFEEHPTSFEPAFSDELVESLGEKIAATSESGVLNLSEVGIVCQRLWDEKNEDDRERVLEKSGVSGLLEEYLKESLDRLSPDDRGLAIGLLSQMLTEHGTRNVISADDLVRNAAEDEDEPVDEKLLYGVLETLETKAKLVRRESRRGVDLYEVVSEFLLPWIARQREERARVRAVRAEALRQEKARRRLMLIAAAAVVVAVALAVVGLLVWHARREATGTRDAAQALIALARQPRHSLSLARSGFDRVRTPETEFALRKALASLRAPMTVGAGGSPVVAAAFSSDGRALVTRRSDGTVDLWNLGDGARTTILEGDPLVGDLALSRDGRVIAGATFDGLRIRPLNGDRVIRRSSGPARLVRSIAFSPDGRRIVTAGSDGVARVWTSTGDIVAELPRPARRSAGRGAQPATFPQVGAAFSPDGKRVVVLDRSGRILVWSLATRRLVGPPVQLALTTRYLTRMQVPGRLTLRAATFASDGRHLVTVDARSTGRIWDLASGKPIGPALPGSDVAISADGRRVAATDGRTVRLYDTATGDELGRLSPTGRIVRVGLSSDGGRIATVIGARAQVWDAVADAGLRLGPIGADVAAPVAFSSAPGAGRFVTVDQDGSARVWETAAGQPVAAIRRPGDRIIAATLADDGERVTTVSAGGRVDTYRTDTRARVATWSIAADEPVADAAFSRDGERLVTVNATGTARIWDVANGERVGSPLQDVFAVANQPFSSDDAVLLTTLVDGTARAWNAETGSPLGPPFGKQVFRSALSPDGTVAATVGSIGVGLWDLRRKPLAVEDLPSAVRGATSVSFGPDGAVVIVGKGNGTVAVVEARNRQLLGVLPAAAEDAIYGIAASPDGTQVVTLGAVTTRSGAVRLRGCEACASTRRLLDVAGSRIGRDNRFDQGR